MTFILLRARGDRVEFIFERDHVLVRRAEADLPSPDGFLDPSDCVPVSVEAMHDPIKDGAGRDAALDSDNDARKAWTGTGWSVPSPMTSPNSIKVRTPF